MKGSVKLPVFIDDARKYVNTTQLRAKYLGASYEAEYCQWQTLHGLGSLMETASLIITPNSYLEGKLIASYPPDPIGDFDVTRATTATRVNSAGLVELVPYNLLNYSQEFDNVAWDKANANGGSAPVITANYAISPDGTQNAYRIQLARTTATSSYSYVYQLKQSLGSGSYTFSVWMKALSGTPTLSLVYDGTNYEGVVTLTNEWVRYEFTTTTNGNAQAGFLLFQQVPSTSLTADFLAYGFQMVEGTSALDYQKTETRLNIPRLDYSNGTCPSLLVEPQRTNLLRYSENFTNGVWGLYSSGTGVNPIVTANTTISPSGILNADTIVLNSGSGTTPSNQSQIYQTFPITIGNVYTLSFYAKGSVGGEQIMVRHAAGSSYTKITLTTEWARYTITETASYSGTGFTELLIRRGLNEPINASATFYIWGAQLELGSYSTSYIPTTSASVTRNADVISKTGISSLIGQTEGVAYIDFDFNSKITSNGVMAFSIDGGAGNEMYILIYSNGNIVWEMYNSGLAQGSITGNIGSFGRKKIALAYKLNDCALYSNGTLIGTDTAATIPAMSRVYLGGFYSSTAYNLSAGINSFALWKTRLTNTQLAQLTTI